MGEGLLQPLHLIIIAFIALIIFGPKRLPELGKGMGQAIRGFKASMKEGDEPVVKESEQKPKE
jgi:sec-independent protein translocase protein TatA